MNNVPINWFDILLVILLLLGIKTGQKRGLSQQLLPLIKWLIIVFAGAFLYEPVGGIIHDSAGLGTLLSYVTAYIGIFILVSIIFSLLKRAAGGKLAGSDVFGKSEFYLGMVAGMIQFVCATFVVLAVLNARLITVQEVQANRAFQKEVYSNAELFPGLHTLQSDVFEKSLIGSWIKKNLEFMLIKPTAPAPPMKQKEAKMP